LPLKDSWVTPNHLTTVRLLLGLAAGAAFVPGTYLWSNLAALLLVLSNVLDHADGELARISRKSSRSGHLYDLASDALVTIALFLGIGVGVGANTATLLGVPPTLLGLVAGCAIALIFWVRMRIEDRAGKEATRQHSIAGFETEDVLYLLPFITLLNGVSACLVAAAVGAPLFAVWVLVDYARTLGVPPLAGDRQLLQAVAAPVAARAALTRTMMPTPPTALSSLDASLMVRLRGLEPGQLHAAFAAQGAFIHLREFLPAALSARLVETVEAVRSDVHRNYLPRHKQGGSVSRHVLDERAPFIGELYRSPTLVGWLESVAGERLQLSPPDDAHAYALYFYTRPGDHIGWHYDTSYYRGRRYTVLLGVLDNSSCCLDYELHTREPGVLVVPGSVRIPPGGLVFFDGDKLRHRITPLAAGEERVSLTFEYVTDPRMHAAGRLVSNMKDAIAYFGFRQVFRRVLSRPKGRT
jgi:phosphatidylglycerophosphate synthase